MKRKTPSLNKKQADAKPAEHHEPPKLSALSITLEQLPDPPRLSQQLRQELSSKSALAAWLYNHGWITSEPKPDLGQDFWVDIYENNRSTGLNLYIQHKSIENIEKAKLKTSPQLSYPLEVKDILHWRKQIVPVIVIICDVHNEDERYWISADDIIKDITAINENWFLQKEVNAHIPLNNRLTTSALNKIRHFLADYFYPTAAKKNKNIQLGIRFSFPETEQGRLASEAYTNFLNTGKPATIKGEYIAEFKLSDWVERLYGKHIPDSLTFGKPRSKTVYFFRLEVQTRNAPFVSSRTLNLRVARSGRIETVLTNKHEDNPLLYVIKFVQHSEQVLIHANITMRHAGNTIFETREALEFIIATHEGSRVQLIEVSSGKSISTMIQPREHAPLANYKRQLELVSRLCFFQQIFDFPKVLSLRNYHLQEADYENAEKLFVICNTGKRSGIGTFSGVVNMETLKTSKAYQTWTDQSFPAWRIQTKVAENSKLKILDREVNLGPSVISCELSTEQSKDYFDKIQRAIEQNAEEVRINIQDSPLELSFPNWEPKHPSLGFHIIDSSVGFDRRKANRTKRGRQLPK